MRARARRWAAGVSADHAYEATSIAAALAAVHGHPGPLLLGAPDVPALDAETARVALEDIAAGCDLSIGLAHDSRPYLIAVARPEESLVAIGARGFEGGLLPAFAEYDVEVGMLAPHRRLTSAADVRAFALDPMTDAALAGLLRTLGAP